MAHGMRTAQFWKILNHFGHDISILNLDPRNNAHLSEQKENFNVTFFTLKHLPLSLLSKYDLIANMDPVILNLPAPFISWMRDVPMISDLQDPLHEWSVMKKSLTKTLFGSIFRYSKFVTTTHSKLKHQLIETLNVDPNKIGIVHNGVDLNFFKFMDVDKDVDVLYTGSPFSFGSLISEVRKECQSRKKKFLWTPFDKRFSYNELPLVLNQSRVCIFPAEESHWHNKLMEYLACGCAVVALETEQTKKIIIDGENGLLADSKEEFLEKIFYLLENDALRKKISTNAVVSVKQYSWNILVKNYEQYLFNVLDGVYET